MFDNKGFEVSVPESAYPVLGSGKTFYASEAAAEYSIALSCGDTYCVTCNGEGPLFMGVSGPTLSEANKEFIIPADCRLKFTIPEVDDSDPTRVVYFSSEKSECKGYGIVLDNT